jgi:hypothetical protein
MPCVYATVRHYALLRSGVFGCTDLLPALAEDDKVFEKAYTILRDR